MSSSPIYFTFQSTVFLSNKVVFSLTSSWLPKNSFATPFRNYYKTNEQPQPILQTRIIFYLFTFSMTPCFVYFTINSPSLFCYQSSTIPTLAPLWLGLSPTSLAWVQPNYLHSSYLTNLILQSICAIKCIEIQRSSLSRPVSQHFNV